MGGTNWFYYASLEITLNLRNRSTLLGILPLFVMSVDIVLFVITGDNMFWIL